MHDPATPKLFDRALIAQKRQRCAAETKKYDFLVNWAGEQLSSRLSDITRRFPTAVQLGLRTSNSALNDIAEKSGIDSMIHFGSKASGIKEQNGTYIKGDEEFLPFKDGSIDLIFSNLNLHTINDLPGTLIQIKRALKPDGLFLASMFGGETLYELRQSLNHAEMKLKGGISPRVLPFADKQQMGGLLQRAGFALPVVDSDIITVTYKDAYALMHDLRGMGESNIITERSRTNPGKAFFAEAAEHYTQNFSEPDGKIVASFEIIFLIGWAPHETQQKPLKPGSAKHRLADALETEEIQTGEPVTS